MRQAVSQWERVASKRKHIWLCLDWVSEWTGADCSHLTDPPRPSRSGRQQIWFVIVFLNTKTCVQQYKELELDFESSLKTQMSKPWRFLSVFFLFFLLLLTLYWIWIVLEFFYIKIYGTVILEIDAFNLLTVPFIYYCWQFNLRYKIWEILWDWPKLLSQFFWKPFRLNWEGLA